MRAIIASVLIIGALLCGGATAVADVCGPEGQGPGRGCYPGPVPW